MRQNKTRENAKLYSSVFIALLTALTLSSCTHGLPPHAAKLAPFTSDGCTLFPDGTPGNRILWCDCCQEHDFAYWQGGSAEERKLADTVLHDCVLRWSHDQDLADAIYFGVRAGGHPAFPLWYRWGYGWPYGRGYQSLTDAERLQVQERTAAYRQQHPAGYCVERNDIP